MKKIYFSHAIDYPDFREKLYQPLKTISGFDFIFPHEDDILKPSKEMIKGCDLFIAEVSYQKLGSGIEIGWADAFGKPVLFMHQKGAHLSRSLSIVSDKFFEYENLKGSVKELEKIIVELTGKTYYV